MSEPTSSLSIVIVTYNRSAVLVDTINYIMGLNDYRSLVSEIIIVDQTKTHASAANQRLGEWSDEGLIEWVRLNEPNLTGAMNRGLIQARGDVVLFLDDDIIPDSNIAIAHLEAHQKQPLVTAVIGQIRQPGEIPKAIDYRPRNGVLKAYMDFPFYSTEACFIENAMAGNMSLKRDLAVKIGGFDERFIPPVAARFESEFAKRVIRQGGSIWFEPKASLQHLAVTTGGTRAKGNHLNSAQAYFGFGDYYFSLKHGSRLECFRYCAYRFYREVRTKYHLRHPWYIPVKWVGEIRALSLALGESRRPPKLIPHEQRSNSSIKR